MFTVVIPVFNHERYLAEAVESASRSALVSEILIMDDGSADRSHAVVASLALADSKITDLTSIPRLNRGAHVCLNELVHAASNEWVAVLNSDDLFVRNRFAVISDYLRDRPDTDLVFGDLLLIDHRGNQVGIKRGPFDPEYAFPDAFSVPQMVDQGRYTELLGHQNFIATTSNMVFRKTLFAKIGGFSDYRYVHDLDFALRASVLGTLGYIRYPLTAYRIHGSNTINHSTDQDTQLLTRLRVDREVRSVHAGVDRDFPELAQSYQLRLAREKNRYLQSFSYRFLSVLPPVAQTSADYVRDIQCNAECNVVEDFSALTPDCEYVYAPATIEGALSPTALLNVKLALLNERLDFALISTTLAKPPTVSVGQLRDHVVFAKDLAAMFIRGDEPGRAARGRIMRLLPGAGEECSTRELFSSPHVLEGYDIVFGGAPPPDVRCTSSEPLVRPQPRSKPLVWIIPIFFAVGGVERVMIEIMRQLREHYDFIVLTAERLTEQLGSLHWAATDLSRCFDLAELLPQDKFLQALKTLKETYPPDVIWICNGSPWLVENAGTVRELFIDTPIVDQQVYDIHHGWINSYDNPGIQSFDRFIACNTRIRDTFTNKLAMNPQRVDMIYPAANIEGMLPIELSELARSNIAAQYSVDPTDTFAFVGRLAEQKRPLRFLELVRRAQLAGCTSKFLLIGDGPLAGDCEQFIAEHRLYNVRRIPFCNPLQLFPAVSGLVITSDYEGLPVVLLEALSNGVPAFATDVGDIRIVLEHYGSGVVVSSDASIDTFHQEWIAFRENLPAYRERARLSAREIRNRFSGKAIAAQYRECFERAIADKLVQPRSAYTSA